MPTRDEILRSLTLIANEGKSIALVWHVLIAVTLAALALGWRPKQRTASTLAVLPIVSAIGAAVVFRNPFNSALLTLGSVALLVLAQATGPREVARGSTWIRAIGLVTIGFGWVYPHFLTGEPRAVYLIAAPVGLLPCPSLAIAVGFALLMGGIGTRAYRFTLAALGLFYGSFGVVRLGVALDGGLIGASLVLAATAFRSALATPGSSRATT